MQETKSIQIIENKPNPQLGSLFESEGGHLQQVRSANRSMIDTVNGETERNGVRVRINDACRYVAIRRLMERMKGREAGIGLQGELDAIVREYIGPLTGKEAWPPTPLQRRGVAEIVTQRVRERTGRDYRLEGVRYLSGSFIEAAVLYRSHVKSKHVVMYEVIEEQGQGNVRLLRLHRMTRQSILWRREDGGPVRGLLEMEDWRGERKGGGSKEGTEGFSVPFDLLTETCAIERVAFVLESIGQEQPTRQPRPFVLLNVRRREDCMGTDALKEAWKRVPIEHMPVPSEAAIQRVAQMTKVLRRLPRGSVRELDNMFEGKERGHINATIKAMQWICACRSNTIYAPGNVLMLKARYVGPMIQPPVVMTRKNRDTREG